MLGRFELINGFTEQQISSIMYCSNAVTRQFSWICLITKSFCSAVTQSHADYDMLIIWLKGGPTNTAPLYCSDNKNSNLDYPKTSRIFRYESYNNIVY